MSDKTVEIIEEAATRAFDGILVEYHRELGLRLCHVIANWVPETHLEDILTDIRYVRGTIETLILDDSHQDRYHKP